jgi:uncharacterized protein YecT (DUF1311 family)
MVLVVGGGLMAGMAGAQSFDCNRATTTVEKAVCADGELRADDAKLAATYRRVMTLAPADVQAEARNDQRGWAKNREDTCAAVAKGQGKRETPTQLVECLKGLYASQIDLLNERVMEKDGVVFVQRAKTLMVKNDPSEGERGEDSGDVNPGFGTMTVTWPEAVRYPAQQTAEWTAWNAAVLRETQRMAGGGGKTTDWQDAWAAGAETEVTAKVDAVGPQLVSVAMGNETMGHGAAHPSESYEEFHWMLAAKRGLAVNDVFQAGSGWEAVVAARCRAELKKMDADYESYAGSQADFAKTLHGVVADPTNWSFDAKGLTISFPEYSVTPRVEPVDPVTVPWSALQGFLVSGFVVPK